ncbi:MAG TPA: FAD-dependent oxidoreductase [Polyangium sp.]|nr:FAD-dependent oxidoreductase [Polyangium sp.]
MHTPSSVLVVGASLGGLSVAEALRREGYAGSLVLLGAERHLPYDRPPLSKKVLAGEWEPTKAELRSAAALEKLHVQLALDEPAVRLDVRAREVFTAAGRSFRADVIVLATGLEPRQFPGQPALTGVHILRTVDECVALRADLLAHSRLVVVGDGVLGTEIAATARAMGLSVTLVGPQELPLGMQLGRLVGEQLARLHTEKGVALRLGLGVEAFVAEQGRVSGVQLKGGEVLPADIVVVAIGSKPAIGWLAESGLELGDGIICDSRCLAAEGIYAVGDVARWYHQGLGASLRLENRSNAVEQAMAVAGNIMGKDRPYVPVPFFWTDQFDTKIQMHGFISPDAEVAILEGDPANRQFTAAYGKHGKVVGVLAWNMIKQSRLYRKHVVEGTAWNDPSLRATPSGGS